MTGRGDERTPKIHGVGKAIHLYCPLIWPLYVEILPSSCPFLSSSQPAARTLFIGPMVGSVKKMKSIPRPVPEWQPSSPGIEDPSSLNDLLSRRSVVVVHFWAPWNGYDIVMDERLQALMPDYADRIALVSINFDNPHMVYLFRECNVLNLPALACFVEGRHSDTLIGMRSEEALAELLDKWAYGAERS